jgi:SAM-dependent methyltransferase
MFNASQNQEKELAEFTDPRLVAVYETVNAYPPHSQPEFYANLSAELDAKSIIDLGCGTGLITRELARLGYQMTGVDPHAPMIEIARTRPHGDLVHWVVGDASQLGTPGADLAIMSGHVAQFFLTDDTWQATLSALNDALRSGGSLAFESRNPAAREWETWTGQRHGQADDLVAGRVETWMEFRDLRGGVVSYTNYYRFTSTGEEIAVLSQLRFRNQEELAKSLADAGFVVNQEYGDWDRRPVSPTAREIIIVAQRT